MISVWVLLLLSPFMVPYPVGEYETLAACQAALRGASYSIDVGVSWHDATHFGAGGAPAAACMERPR